MFLSLSLRSPLQILSLTFINNPYGLTQFENILSFRHDKTTNPQIVQQIAYGESGREKQMPIEEKN